jgi:predicted RNase H-like HicB family nuclease
MAQEFYVIVERDEDGLYVGEVSQLQGCYSQGKTLDELMQNMKEVIALCLEDLSTLDVMPEFVGVQKVMV